MVVSHGKSKKLLLILMNSMTELDLFEVLWNVQSLEKKGIYLKDFDPMDVKNIYDFGRIVDNYKMMHNKLKENYDRNKQN